MIENVIAAVKADTPLRLALVALLYDVLMG